MQNQSENGMLEEFRIDVLDCWKKLPNKGFFLVLFAAWMALFILVGNPTLGYINSPSLIRWMLDAYNPMGNYLDSDDGHGVLVPFIVLALFWWKRKELMALPMDTWWPGLVILGGALVMHLVAYMIQQPKISVIAMFLGIYGLLGLAWGRKWMVASFFPRKRDKSRGPRNIIQTITSCRPITLANQKVFGRA